MTSTAVQLHSTVTQLLDGLVTVLPFVNRTSKFLPLQYAKVSMTAQGGMVEGTDLQLGYVGPITLEGEGTICVPAHPLVALLKNCDPAAHVILNHTPAGMVRVRIGEEGRYQLKSIAEDEFPMRREGTTDAQQ